MFQERIQQKMTIPNPPLDVVETEGRTRTRTKSKSKKEKKDKKGNQGKKGKVKERKAQEDKANVRVKDKGSTMEKVPHSQWHRDPILNSN